MRRVSQHRNEVIWQILLRSGCPLKIHAGLYTVNRLMPRSVISGDSAGNCVLPPEVTDRGHHNCSCCSRNCRFFRLIHKSGNSIYEILSKLNLKQHAKIALFLFFYNGQGSCQGPVLHCQRYGTMANGPHESCCTMPGTIIVARIDKCSMCHRKRSHSGSHAR